ncbi:MAG: alkaline phosphatase family protein [Candidatus Acidiferrales bacterium]
MLRIKGAPAANANPSLTRRVLLVSIDGLHALDLANFIRSDPNSTLAQLSTRGVTYTQASTSKPSDSFPGLMSIITGGSPISTGVWYEGSYAHSLSPPGSNCATQGTQVVWDSSIDRDKKAPEGGGLDPGKLPLDPSKGCTPVFPHNYLRVNTIFELVHAAGMRTAWSDKHPSYEMVNGPSGRGVDDLFTPEISGSNATRDLKAAEVYDDSKVQAVLNEIDGKDHTGRKSVGVPALWGLSLQEVSVAQKLVTGGYADVLGTPSAALLEAITHADESVGKLLDALQERNLASSTLIVITAKHGESPIGVRRRQIVADSILPRIIKQSHSGVLALAYQDGDLASIWLSDQSQTSKVVETLSRAENESALDIQEILAGESLKLMFNDPLQDNRTPDIVLIPNFGGIYIEEGSKFIAEHGGFNDQDTNVALLLAGPGLKQAVIKTPVQTTQIAPTILRALRLDPKALQAVEREKTTPLPAPFDDSKIGQRPPSRR